MYGLKKKTCTQCGQEKYHGAVCVLKSERGMRWICSECMQKIEDRDKVEKAREDA